VRLAVLSNERTIRLGLIVDDLIQTVFP